MAIGVGDRHRQATRAGPVAVHVQFAERRIAVEHFEGCLFIEMTLETFRRRILDRILAAILGEQAGTSERRENDLHCNSPLKKSRRFLRPHREQLQDTKNQATPEPTAAYGTTPPGGA